MLIALLLFPVAAAASPFSCPALDSTAKRAMEGWQVPGMAVGVVAKSRVALTRFYGVRDIESGTRITPHTLFGLGSITKTVTALAAATASSKGKLSLDMPVRHLLPHFPAGITMRQLLAHTAGWPRHDALWYLDAYDRKELVRRLALLPRFAPPGAAYQYNNVTYAAVGLAFAKAVGTSWENWTHLHILRPAGMMDSVTSVSAFRSSDNRATGYFPGDEGRIAIPLRDTDPVAPAAGLYASLHDMLRYLELLTTGGRVGGRRIVPAAAIRTILGTVRDARGHAYGIGFEMKAWNGTPLAYHPGYIDGYGARLSLLPKRHTGIIVLTNISGKTPVPQIVSQTLLDCLTGAAPTDRVARFGNRRPPPEPKPALPAPAPLDRPATAFSGSYVNPSYGDISFEPGTDPGTLTGHFHGRTFTLDYAGNDAWRLGDTDWPLRRGLLFSFSRLASGRFDRMTTPLADGPTYRHEAGPLAFDRTASPR